MGQLHKFGKCGEWISYSWVCWMAVMSGQLDTSDKLDQLDSVSQIDEVR